MAKARFHKGQIVLYDPCAENMPPIILAMIFRVHDGPAYTEPLYSIEWGKSNKATVRESDLSPAGDLAPEPERNAPSGVSIEDWRWSLDGVEIEGILRTWFVVEPIEFAGVCIGPPSPIIEMQNEEVHILYIEVCALHSIPFGRFYIDGKLYYRRPLRCDHALEGHNDHTQIKGVVSVIDREITKETETWGIRFNDPPSIERIAP